jgi:hypothetical protein
MLKVNVAWPPRTGLDPSLFFPDMTVTTPVGVPAPGATGKIPALTAIEAAFPLPYTPRGISTTRVLALAIDSDSCGALRKPPSPL